MADAANLEFGGFLLDLRRRSLTDPAGDAVHLKPKVFDTLAFLVEQRGELLTKACLLEAVWPGSVVEENSLNQNISTLRRVLGEKPGENRFIATVPGRGYQFVAEVRELSADKPSAQAVAVLPFRNLSGDAEQAYFVDGMFDELIARLSRLSRLRVVSRTSASVYRNSDKSVPVIGAELGVDFVVEGSVLRAGQRVRTTVQLIDAATDAHIWADVFEQSFADIMLLQSEMSRAIAREIAVALNDDETASLDAREPVDPAAYDACLKGLEHFYKLTPADLDQSLRYFQHACRIDPYYARAHAGIAHVWIGRQQMGFVPTPVATPLAKEAALRAIELDDSLPDGPFIMSLVKAFGEFDVEAAERYMQKALALNPSFAEARAMYSHELLCLGRFDEARDQVERAVSLDPFNPFFKAFHSVVLYFRGDYTSAMARMNAALELFPTLPFALQVQSNIAFHLGDPELTLDAQRRLMQALGNQPALDVIVDSDDVVTNLRRLADVTAAQSLEARNGGMWVAFRYLHAGDIDQGFEWAAKAIDQRDPNAPYIRGGFPEFRGYRDDPRFDALVTKLDESRHGMYFET